MNEEVKCTYRLPPCPAYDIAGTESWLADMAGEGYVLARDGFFAGVATFERRAPIALRYRLQPAPKQVSLWADDNGAPDEEAVALSEALGWEYVASCGQFHVYCTAQPGARELNTDPRVQALALDMVRKRERGSLAALLLWLLLYPIAFLRGNLVLASLSLGTGLMLGALLIIAWLALRRGRALVHLRRLRRKLAAGQTPEHGKNWRRHAHVHQLLGALLALAALLLCGAFLHAWQADAQGEGERPLTEAAGSFPFATMRDLAPEGAYALDQLGFTNTVSERADLLAPVVIRYREAASITLPDGALLQGALTIDYIEAASPWLAREILREWRVIAWDNARHRGGCVPLEIPDLGVEETSAYVDSLFPTILLRQGNVALRAAFYQTSPTYEMPLAEWAAVFADRMRGG